MNSMTIRPAEDSDIPSIIALLKVSLGESLIPKSEQLWRWKHLDNPYGKSPVLLAEQQGQLIGIRAFLRWDFVRDGHLVKACRAVDTATHPAHQGKGIFSRLTLALIEQMKSEGIELIFNTPNDKSTPGYLKMGWRRWGKLPLKLQFYFGGKPSVDTDPSDWALVTGLIIQLEQNQPILPHTRTRLLPGYIQWRYVDMPLFPYHYLSDGESYLLVYRIKDGKMGKELRICDLFTTRHLSSSQKHDLKKSVAQAVKNSGARFSSFSGLQYPHQSAISLGLLPTMKIGPLVTLRNVENWSDGVAQPWDWSLGDLEVF